MAKSVKELKHISLATVDFTNHEENFVCSMINRYGSGQHPCADNNNLHGFYVKYTLQVLKKAKKKLSETGLVMAEQVLTKLTEVKK